MKRLEKDSISIIFGKVLDDKYPNHILRKKAKNKAWDILYQKLWEFGILKKDIRINRFGKKYVDCNSDVYFNVSYSGKYFAIVISEENVGIDLEEIRERTIKDLITCFNEEERQIIEASKNSVETFLRYWTIKEAYGKFIGMGLQMDISLCMIEFEQMQLGIWIKNVNQACSFFQLKITGCVLTICQEKESKIFFEKVV